MTLPRMSLASQICPWVPFLAPRFLHSSRPVATLRLRCFTSTRGFRLVKTGGGPKAGQLSRRPQFIDAQFKKDRGQLDLLLRNEASVLNNLKTACDACHVPAIVNLYPNIVSLPSLDRDVPRRMAQAIHAYIRSSKTTKQEIRASLPLVERIVTDIRSGRLPPHPIAHRHILSIYKECEKYDLGVEFWQWLVNQNDQFVDPSVYGAAIELLAFKGDVTLRSLEDLFSHALKRFPGTFAEYHLSPDAIVPDRSQPFDVIGVPITLLQGILTARVLARDWKNAYLALDTALRLHPTSLPPRFFELFVIERPLSEAYTVFLMACRAGVQLKSNHLMAVMSRLRASMSKDAPVEERVILVRAMTNAIYAYMETGGKLEGPHISVLLNTGYADILPSNKPGPEHTDQFLKLRNAIVTGAHQMASKLMQAGFSGREHTLVALLNIAGKLEVPELFAVALRDVATYNIDIGHVGNRVVLKTAGRLGDIKEIERRWALMAAAGENEGSSLASVDWITLARACRQAKHEEFCSAQLQMLRHAVNEDTEKRVRAELSYPSFEKPAPSNYMDPDAFVEQMEVMQSNMNRVAAIIMAGQPLDLRMSPFDMSLSPSVKPYGGSMTNLSAVYDEFTTDPHQPAKTSDGKASHPSTTGIPLDELRFQNWVSIVRLMAEAELGEQVLQEKLESAISESRFFDTKLHFADFKLHRDIDKFLEDWNPSYAELLAKIRGLRAPDASHDEVADRVLPPRYRGNGHFSGRPTASEQRPVKKVPLRVYTSAKSSHSASMYAASRSLVLERFNGAAESSEPTSSNRPANQDSTSSSVTSY